MKQMSALKLLLPLLIVAFAFMSCEQNVVGTFEDAIDRVPNVQTITGAENVTLNVTNDRDRSYFRVSVSNIAPNSDIANGVYYAWCVELDKPLSTGQNLDGAKLFSTRKDAAFNKVAYIINNRYTLERENPGLSWREIQVAIWVITDSPDMTLGSIADRISIEGYNESYVNNIISDVKSNGSSFTPGMQHTNLILMDAGNDEQLIVGESNTAWARMNNDPDDFLYAFNPDPDDPSIVAGGNWATYIKVIPNDDPQVFYLYAGQTNWVGLLNVSRDADNLYVEFDLFDDYRLNITHVHVGLEFPDDFPTAGNPWDNPQIGQFDYGDSYDYVQNVTETIPFDSFYWDDLGQELLIAAHAVVWDVEEL